tara:strand:+ start:2593 stop:3270 length:678 start_codon:yes stop_codon:yes gene_type:complete
MIKYKIIDNFLSSKECENLINDAEKTLNNSGNRQELNNNREITSSTSIEFYKILSNSINWKRVNSKLSSQQFLDDCFKKLNENSKKFILTNFYSLNNLNKLRKKFKELQNKKVGFLTTFALIKIIFYRLYLSSYKFLKYKLTSKFFVELIYDYSKAKNGYKREIHRDSDSRTLIFLLYLNDLDPDTKGGSLNMYEYLDKKKKIYHQDPIQRIANLLKRLNQQKEL